MADMQMFDHLARIRAAALAAVEPGAAVRRSLRLEGDRLWLGEVAWRLPGAGRMLLVAAGKAAPAMAQAAASVLGERLTGGVVVTRYGHAAGYVLPASIAVIEASHPVPDENGLAGARRLADVLQSAGADDRVLALISGGASALLPLPVAGVSLADLQAVTDLLLRSGADIAELNAVRKHLDRLKGGGMLRLAQPAPLAALILSDVVGDRLEVIASGPTVADPTTYADAWGVLERRGLLARAPKSVLAVLSAGARGDLPETLKPGDPLLETAVNVVIGSNQLAAQAAAEEAQRLGYQAAVISTALEGEAREVGQMLAGLARGVIQRGEPLPPPACLVLGGETTVTVRGFGRGGRNQEAALAAATALEGLDAAVMALATDGSDGPTDAGGALVDGQTAGRARALGINLAAALANNDSYPALDRLGALIKTGPTGTNVNDLLVVLVGRLQR